jgi:hypothetical protein
MFIGYLARMPVRTAQHLLQQASFTAQHRQSAKFLLDHIVAILWYVMPKLAATSTWQARVATLQRASVAKWRHCDTQGPTTASSTTMFLQL